MQKGFGVIYVLVGILVIVGITGGAYYLGKSGAIKPTPTPSEPKVCAQMVTAAKNLAIGECKEFPTPCDVPSDWQPIGGSVCPSSSDETANWQTYTNEDGRYSFKYPSFYTLHPNEVALFETGWKFSKNTTELVSSTAVNFPNSIAIKYSKVENGISLNEYLAKNSWCESITLEKGKRYLVDGVEVLIFENTRCGVSGTTEIDMLHNSRFYTINLDDCCEQEEMLNNFKKILSTFKFLN